MAIVFAVAIFCFSNLNFRNAFGCIVENLKVPVIPPHDHICYLKKITFAALNKYDE